MSVAFDGVPGMELRTWSELKRFPADLSTETAPVVARSLRSSGAFDMAMPLRRLLSETGRVLENVDDDQIFDVAASHITSGQWVFAEPGTATRTAPVSPQARGPKAPPAPPPPPPPPAPVKPPPTRRASTPPRPHTPSDVLQMDQQAQADALTAAAEEGVPFCEECARTAGAAGG